MPQDPDSARIGMGDISTWHWSPQAAMSRLLGCWVCNCVIAVAHAAKPLKSQSLPGAAANSDLV
jgi:hypothetical protein